MPTLEEYRLECQRLENLLLEEVAKNQNLSNKNKLLDIDLVKKDAIIDELKEIQGEFTTHVAEMIQANANAQGRLLNYINEKFKL